jgi:hypothetical protein
MNLHPPQTRQEKLLENLSFKAISGSLN